MTHGDKIGRMRYEKLIRRIFITFLTSAVAYLITRYFIGGLTDQSQMWARMVSVFVGGIALLVQFMADFEKRMESVEQKQAVHSTEMQSLVKEELAGMNEVMELFQAVEASALQADIITQLVQHATQITPNSPPLVYEFAQLQIGRMSQFLKNLSDGGDVSYEGEDRDWLLGLTVKSQCTIDATSLSTVDAALWTSDLGQRYLERQREAMRRGVVIRRVFIRDSPGQIREPDFLYIYRQQQTLGIHSRVLDGSTAPQNLKSLLFDFIVFDGVISYEVTPAARVEDTMKPTIIRTYLALQSERVKERMQLFEKIWDSARELN